VRDTAEVLDLSKSTVARLRKMRCLKKHQIKATVSKRTMKQQEKEIARLLKVRTDRDVQVFHSTKLLSRELNRTGKATISKTTTWRRLRSAKLVCRVRPKSPNVEEHDEENRLTACTAEMEGANIVAVDEKNFDQNDHYPFFEWVAEGQKARPRQTYNFSPTVQVFGAIGIDYRHLVILPQHLPRETDEQGRPVTFRLTADSYVRRCLAPIRAKLQQPGITLLHDGARCHQANQTKAYLNRWDIQYFDPWPARSPGLNPIENMWSLVQAQVSLRAPRDRDELVQFIREEWELIPVEKVNNFVRSFAQRVRKCRENGGKL